MQALTDEHWSAVKWILCYIKFTIQHGLFLSRHFSVQLTVYTDADCAGSIDNRIFTSGYCFFLGTNLISWSSKKQCTVARSSTEAEYRGMANAAAEVIWLQSLLREFGVPQSPPLVLCDNLSAAYLSINLIRHSHSKHVETDIHFMRDYVTNGVLNVRFVSTKDQQADILTKSLSSLRFSMLKNKLSNSFKPASLARGC